MANSMPPKLQRLCHMYERLALMIAKAVNQGLPTDGLTSTLSNMTVAVEKEADATGYLGHAHLAHLHTLAEQCMVSPENRDKNWKWLNSL